MKVPVTFGAVLTIALVPIAAAHADTPDERFLKAVDKIGIALDPATLIAEGHAACDNYGTPAADAQTKNLSAQGIASVRVANLKLAAIRAYCPEKMAGSPLAP